MPDAEVLELYLNECEEEYNDFISKQKIFDCITFQTYCDVDFNNNTFINDRDAEDKPDVKKIILRKLLKK